jgi:hypothetical protein
MNVSSKILAIFILFYISLFLSDFHSIAFAQIKGEPTESLPPDKPDSVFIFISPRPLIDANLLNNSTLNAWGLDVIFSNNGVGAGIFWGKYFNENLLALLSLYVSGARNTDEFEYYNGITGGYEVYNKINRLYMFPLTAGILHFLFSDVLTETLKPYVSAGLGPAFIISAPYRDNSGNVIDFFKSLSFARSYIKFALFAGIGAYIGNLGSSLMSLNMRYYFIPFGGNGLESIAGNPIKDFGGVFLSLTIGTKY